MAEYIVYGNFLIESDNFDEIEDLLKRENLSSWILNESGALKWDGSEKDSTLISNLEKIVNKILTFPETYITGKVIIDYQNDPGPSGVHVFYIDNGKLKSKW